MKKNAAGRPEKLGTVHFQTSCDPAVQPLFERGVALLHSFWFPEGLKTFNEVLKRDPSCTIAYWGIGVNRLLNPFGGQAAEAVALQGQEAIDKGLALPAKSQRERDYLEAIAAFYGRDRAPFRVRAVRYEEAMEKLAAKYPEDKEASIFYALALNIASDPMDKTFAKQLKAAQILEPVFVAQPDHPGVAHYLIHSYDYPPIAQKGLPAARRYSDIAPDAAHALHMPSHIFTRVGAWEDSLVTNKRSEQNALANKSAQDMHHALDYQVYAALQLARDREAREAMARMKALPPNPDQRPSFYALASVPARIALERGDWKSATALEAVPNAYLYTVAMTHFGRGYGAARLGDWATAAKEAGELGNIQQQLAAQNDKYWATEVEVQRLSVAAWGQLAKGRARQRARADAPGDRSRGYERESAGLTGPPRAGARAARRDAARAQAAGRGAEGVRGFRGARSEPLPQFLRLGARRAALRQCGQGARVFHEALTARREGRCAAGAAAGEDLPRGEVNPRSPGLTAPLSGGISRR
jgi:hypothetical protein